MLTETFTPAAAAIKVYADGRLDSDAAGNYLGLSTKTLAMMRSRGTGPSFVKLGRAVFYRRDDLDAWIEKNRARSTAEYRVKRNTA